MSIPQPLHSRQARLQRVTPADDGHYFFGYYDKCPWDPSGRRLLAMRSTFMDRRPGPADSLTLGYVDLANGRYVPFAQTLAWNWQQGCMLQWLGEDRVIFNDRRDGRLIARSLTLSTGTPCVYDRPIYALAPSGEFALSLNFARLARVRPGYGYVGAPDPAGEEVRPTEDGIWRLDLATGRSKLLLTVAQVAEAVEADDEPGMLHWLNHIQFNRSGSRFVFLHRWGKPGGQGAWWSTRLMVADADGGNLRCLSDHGMVSHYDWLDDRRLVAWASWHGIGDRYFVFDHTADEPAGVIGEGVLDCDGHCSFSPDAQLMLTDTYPDHEGNRQLLIWHLAEQRMMDLGKFHGPTPTDIETRCDLHPRWSRDGRQICVDSCHEGPRAVYVLDWTPEADAR